MKNKLYGMFTLLALNTALIAMDPPQQPWWHTGKSNLCQLYRGIGHDVVESHESMMALAILDNNQWWYSDFKVVTEEPLSPPICLSDDGRCMAVACGQKIELYNAQTGIKTKDLDLGWTRIMSFRDKLAIGRFDEVQILGKVKDEMQPAELTH